MSEVRMYCERCLVTGVIGVKVDVACTHPDGHKFVLINQGVAGTNIDNLLKIDRSFHFTKALSDTTAPDISESACGHLVDINETLTAALETVSNETPKCCLSDGANRIKPIVLSRLSRGGKTTVAIKLFDELRKLPGFLPIFISFNGNAHYKSRNHESHEHAILRRIAVQFTDETDDFNFDVDKETLLEYINSQSESGEKSVVLIIDELNVLSSKLDEYAAELLRVEFLDKKNRYLVITTHVPMTVDITIPVNSDAVLGKRPASAISSSSSSGSSSDRGVHVIHMPLSVNLDELRGMSNECSALTPFEAVFYGGIPSLVYSIKGGQFLPMTKILNFYKENYINDSIPVANFLELVLTGVCDSNLSIFDGFGTAEEGGRMRFPLCYIDALLVTWFKLNCFHSLYEEIQHFGTKECTGLDWETVVQYAVMIRCVYASKVREDRGPFNILPEQTQVNFLFIAVPGEHSTIDTLIDYVQPKLLKDCLSPTLVMVNSQSAQFPMFDGFVWYYDPASNNCSSSTPLPKIIGYQCKQGNKCNLEDVPESISEGVLIRGYPPTTTRCEKRKWRCLNLTDTDNFVGYSLKPLVPERWPKV